MSGTQNNTTLRNETERFVKKVLTEFYGQSASRQTVAMTADRVMAAIPTQRQQSSSPKRDAGAR